MLNFIVYININQNSGVGVNMSCVFRKELNDQEISNL